MRGTFTNQITTSSAVRLTAWRGVPALRIVQAGMGVSLLLALVVAASCCKSLINLSNDGRWVQEYDADCGGLGPTIGATASVSPAACYEMPAMIDFTDDADGSFAAGIHLPHGKVVHVGVDNVGQGYQSRSCPIQIWRGEPTVINWYFMQARTTDNPLKRQESDRMRLAVKVGVLLVLTALTIGCGALGNRLARKVSRIR
jgi:hypothetical protein